MYSFKHPLCGLAVVAAAAFYLAPALAADTDTPIVQKQGDISYISGGIGKEEIQTLEATQHNYNLRILSADSTGHYSGDVHIVISDLEHHALIDTTGGPLFYTNLPNGHYVVEGFSAGQISKQSITIANEKPVSVRFNWQRNFADAYSY